MNLLYWIIIVVMVLVVILIIIKFFLSISKSNNNDGMDIRQLKEFIKKDKEAMKNVSCDYSYNLSNDVVVLYKRCDHGYDRYYIPLNSWFKNKKSNQTLEETTLCIRKAYHEIKQKNDKYSLDRSTKDLWFTVKCPDEEIQF